MIRILLFFILICKFTYSVAQYEPPFSQNMFNQSSVNPGFAGSSGKVAVSSLIRQQMIGIDGAPKTTVLSADAGLKMLGYEHGVGLNFMSDKIGSFENIWYSLSYSYKIDIAEGQLGAGLSVGLVSTTLKGGDLYTDPRNVSSNTKQLGANDYHDQMDLFVPQSDVTDASLDLGWGVFYKEKNWYSGFSVMHMNQPKISFDRYFAFSVKRTWFLTSGYTFMLKDSPFDIEPSFLLKQMDLSIK